MVHRTIEPANLFVFTRPDGSRHVKLLDFGVAHVLLDSVPSAAAASARAKPLGSPLYKSPEQLGGATDLDPRSDIWSLGVVLYELLTGRLPFRGDSRELFIEALQRDPPAPFSAATIFAPDGLETRLGRALSKRREQRYATVAEFAAAIAPFARREFVPALHEARVAEAAAPRAPSPKPVPAPPATSAPPAVRGPRASPPPLPSLRPKVQRWRAIAIIPVLCACAAALFLLARPQSRVESPPLRAAATPPPTAAARPAETPTAATPPTADVHNEPEPTHAPEVATRTASPPPPSAAGANNDSPPHSEYSAPATKAAAPVLRPRGPTAIAPTPPARSLPDTPVQQASPLAPSARELPDFGGRR
jgi:serine/threonine-protein kinase